MNPENIKQPTDGTMSDAETNEAQEADAPVAEKQEEVKEEPKKSKSNIKKLLSDRNKLKDELKNKDEQLAMVKDLLGVEDLSGLTAEDGEDSEDKVKLLFQKYTSEAEVKKSIDHFRNQVPEADREKFDEEFNALVGGTDLTTSNVNKFIKATASIMYPDGENKQALASAQQMVAGSGGGSAGGKTASQKKMDKDIDYALGLASRAGSI